MKAPDAAYGVVSKRYGDSRWSSSAGRSVLLKLGRFYLFFDFGRRFKEIPHE
jgi:hypothetical protein